MFQLSPNWPLSSGSEGRTRVAKTRFFYILNLHGLLRCAQHKQPVTRGASNTEASVSDGRCDSQYDGPSL